MYFLYRPYPFTTTDQPAKLPVRPLRWRAFWRGSVYANPVNDVIGQLLDLGAKVTVSNNIPADRLRIIFTQEAIQVETPGNNLIAYPYAEIRDLRFHAIAFPSPFQREAKTNTLNFRTTAGETQYAFTYNAAKLRNICAFLLVQRIPFKEYLGGARAHLGRQDLSYREIQELKKKYGLVW